MKIIYFVILLVFASCQVDPEILISDHDCISIKDLVELLDYEDGDIDIGQGFLSNDTGTASAIYSYTDEEQIISYYCGYLSSYENDLIKYGVTSGEYSTIMNNPDFYSYPVVSINNWLLFTGSDLQLWKIKTDGDSLTQITSSGMNFQYDWAPDGKSIIYSTTAISGFYNGVIADDNGNIITILPADFSISIPSWSPNRSKIAYRDNNNLRILDTETWESKMLLVNETDDPNKQILSIDFFPDSQNILWLTPTTLNKTNIETGNTSILASTCDSEGFRSVSISPNGENMLIKKTIYEYFDSKHLILSSRIFLYNALGEEIKEIVF